MSVGTSAALIAAGVGAAGSISSALIGSHAAGKAADIQQQAANKVAGMATDAATSAQSGLATANGTLGDLYKSELGNLSPYLGAGAFGVQSLQSAFSPGGSLAGQFAGPNPQDISSTPEYQFQLQQGTQAVNRNAAATGSLGTGGTLKALTQYGQGLASTAYQQAYNNALNTFQTNHNNTLNGLLALTGVGQNAVGQANAAAQNYGGQTLNSAEMSGQFGLQGAQIAGQALTGGANAAAQGSLNQASAWQSGLNGVGNSAMNYAVLNSLGGLQQPPPPQKASNNYLVDPVIANHGMLGTALDNSGYYNRTIGMSLG